MLTRTNTARTTLASLLFLSNLDLTVKKRCRESFVDFHGVSNCDTYTYSSMISLCVVVLQLSVTNTQFRETRNTRSSQETDNTGNVCHRFGVKNASRWNASLPTTLAAIIFQESWPAFCAPARVGSVSASFYYRSCSCGFEQFVARFCCGLLPRDRPPSEFLSASTLELSQPDRYLSVCNVTYGATQGQLATIL